MIGRALPYGTLITERSSIKSKRIYTKRCELASRFDGLQRNCGSRFVDVIMATTDAIKNWIFQDMEISEET